MNKGGICTLIPVFKNKDDIQRNLWERVIEQILRGKIHITENQFAFMFERLIMEVI